MEDNAELLADFITRQEQLKTLGLMFCHINYNMKQKLQTEFSAQMPNFGSLKLDW